MLCFFKDFVMVNPADEPEKRVVRHAYIIVKEQSIYHVGNDKELAESLWFELINANDKLVPKAEVLVYEGKGDKVIMPTFADCHSHLAMTLLRNSADDENLEDWLYNTIFPREKRLRPSDIKVGTELACLEMIAGGIGLTCDMYFQIENSIPVVMEAGMRYVPSFDDKFVDADGKTHVSDAYIERFLELKKQYSDEQLKISYMVHSIYLYEPDFYEEAAAYLQTRPDFLLQVHAAETEVETANCLAKYGRRPIQQLAHFNLLNERTIAAHCVHLDDEDREILAAKKCSVIHNPVSNLKLGSGIADLIKLKKCGINVALGTDGAASNNSLDMLAEAKTAAILQHALYRQANALSCADVLQIATYNGYQAVKMQGGILAVGMPADMQIIDLEEANTWPPADPLATLLYSANRSQVESVMVLGKFLYRNREYLTLDKERILFEAVKASEYVKNVE